MTHPNKTMPPSIKKNISKVVFLLWVLGGNTTKATTGRNIEESLSSTPKHAFQPNSPHLEPYRKLFAVTRKWIDKSGKGTVESMSRSCQLSPLIWLWALEWFTLTNHKYEAGPQQLGWPWDLQNNELAWNSSSLHKKTSFDLGDPLREADLQLGRKKVLNSVQTR